MNALNKEAGNPLFPGFVAMSVLWEGENPPYPSEHSARWAFGQLRERLLAEGAVLVHGHRTMIHVEKFGKVVAELALEKARQRYRATTA